MSQSIDPKEVDQFSHIAQEWWDEEGKFKPLHQMNPTRLSFLKEVICQQFDKDPFVEKPLDGLKILDIGCGGGILSEPLSRLGASVTGVDPSAKSIRVAQDHAEQSGIAVSYRCCAVEEIDDTYDIVLALEVVEHVINVDAFLKTCTSLVKEGGGFALSTLNRTKRSYLTAIVGAEYIMRWLPRGTHDWNKFIKPGEIADFLRPYDFMFEKLRGFDYNPLKQSWSLSQDLSVNYIGWAVKL